MRHGRRAACHVLSWSGWIDFRTIQVALISTGPWPRSGPITPSAKITSRRTEGKREAKLSDVQANQNLQAAPDPFMAPPKAEVRREIEALNSGVNVTRCPTDK